MLRKGIIPYSATWPVILAILIGPPSWEVSADPVIIFPKYFNEVTVTNQTSFSESENAESQEEVGFEDSEV